ncbi:DUF397 domain-containing protein [Kitasatospora misakiensis]|uniref:DUF397 domain-containing protein n=1 Tax=Kitasatospora misakiensis TaxID=67330 RepID=A0ABW0X966_9ACTN
MPQPHKDADWFKSSYSSQQGDNCIEALRLTSGIAIRDSKDKSGPSLQFSADAWQSLLAEIKAERLG